MDKWSKAFLAGTSSGVWFIAFLAGMAWMRFTGNSPALPSAFEALIFLGLPFGMAFTYGIFAFGFLSEAGKAERGQRLDTDSIAGPSTKQASN